MGSAEPGFQQGGQEASVPHGVASSSSNASLTSERCRHGRPGPGTGGRALHAGPTRGSC